eukprot:scaffold221979_cov33-Tisochrysis_lutea.AAC.1
MGSGHACGVLLLRPPRSRLGPWLHARSVLLTCRLRTRLSMRGVYKCDHDNNKRIEYKCKCRYCH